MNKYNFSIRIIELSTWKKEQRLAMLNVAIAIKKLEIIENKIKELEETEG